MKRYLPLALTLLFPVFNAHAATGTLEQTSTKTAAEITIDKFENGLRGYYLIEGESQTANIRQQMNYYRIPGVSIAAIHDGRYVFVKAYGYKDNSTKQELLPTTLLQAASMSEPISVLGALKLVSQGKLDLDRNINDYLIEWKVPNNKYTEKHPVTARLLMAHLAGTNVSGFPGIDSSVKDLPGVVDVLNGKKPLIKTDPVEVINIPGSAYAYSGGGTTILQLAMMDITGQDFPDWMKQNVLNPFAMTHSTFEQPLPESYAVLTSSGHDKNGIVYKGKYYSYPEEAAAGLWTVPSEIIGILNHLKMAYYGHCSPLNIESTVFAQMFTEQKPSPFGLGFMLESAPEVFTFGYEGINDGFQSKMIAFVTPKNSKAKLLDDAIVIMSNSDNGHYILDQLVNSFSDAYGIPYHKAIKVKPQSYPFGLNKYRISFSLKSSQAMKHKVIIKNKRLYLNWFDDDYLEQLYYIGNNTFVTGSGYKLVYVWKNDKLFLDVTYQNNPSEAVSTK